MALKFYLLVAILKISSIDPSSALTWTPNIDRYESYDLDRGPVIYEAYYPESNEETRNNNQEKDYFDRGSILERTYQLPSSNREPGYPGKKPQYPEKFIDPRLLQLEEARRIVPQESRMNFRDSLLRENLENLEESRLDSLLARESLNIKEISNIAKRAISRDLENWSAIKNYLDHIEYPSYRRQIAAELGYAAEAVPAIFERDSLKKEIQLTEEATQDALKKKNLPSLETWEDRAPGKSIVDPYPRENIYEPRPQIINYVFSRKTIGLPRDEIRLPERKIGSSAEILARNYGDNPIKEEKQRTEEAKVTSIQVSEVPRHKTRHHHGDLPKRDYTHRRQA